MSGCMAAADWHTATANGYRQEICQDAMAEGFALRVAVTGSFGPVGPRKRFNRVRTTPGARAVRESKRPRRAGLR
jgi:hypothetical protein